MRDLLIEPEQEDDDLSLIIVDKIAHPELKTKQHRRIKNPRFKLIDLE
jgi:hypothetical protein